MPNLPDVTDEAASIGLRGRLGLLLGPLVFLAMVLIPAPAGLSPAGWHTAAVTVLMAVWWITEAVPIPVTSLLPLALFPLLGVLDMGNAAAPYANELIFLFMGGFFIATAMQRSGLHRRIALRIVSAVGTGPERLVLGFMLATAFLSMWISNTATTAMMLPVALAVAELLKPPGHEGEPYSFGISLMLAIAYASSIGGIGTLIGTPPNAILAGAVQQFLGYQIGFGQWMLIGVPVAALLLPTSWWLLTHVLYRPGRLAGDVARVVAEERASLGPVSRAERIVAIVFVLTALAWILREPKVLGTIHIPGIATFAPAIRDSTIAIIASLALFAIPLDLKRGAFVLEWKHATRISWGVLLLFGGGLSLARAMDESGLAAWIGSGITMMGNAPLWVIVLTVTTLIVFLTEVTSNAATATMAMPILAGIGAALHQPAMVLMATACLSASMAYMLPVATPPNAIVFSSGYLTIPQMARAGFWMNLISIGIITAAGLWLIPVVLR